MARVNGQVEQQAEFPILMILSPENDIIRQLVLVVRFIRKILLQRLSDGMHAFGDAFHEPAAGEMASHDSRLRVPEIGSHLLVNPVIAQDRELAVADRHIQQDAVTVPRVMHLRLPKDLHRAVNSMDEPAAMLHEHPYFTGSHPFRVTDRLDDLEVFSLGKKFLFPE